MENINYKDRNNYCDDTYITTLPSTKEKIKDIMGKDKITSLELLDQINFFREQEGKAKTNHKDLLIIIETEFTDVNRKRIKRGVCPVSHTLIKEQLKKEGIEISVYKHPQNNQEYPMYILPLEKAKQCLIKESKFVRRAMIHYIEELENKVKVLSQRLTERQKLILDIYEGGEKGTRASKLLLELETKELKKDIEHKQDIIKGLTDDITLREKRQILNKVVRYDKKVSFQTRWRMLYLEFEGKYHINLDLRVENYNIKYNKHVSKLDYICEVLHQLDNLYNIACKLFAGDIEKIIAEYKKVI